MRGPFIWLQQTAVSPMTGLDSVVTNLNAKITANLYNRITSPENWIVSGPTQYRLEVAASSRSSQTRRTIWIPQSLTPTPPKSSPSTWIRQPWLPRNGFRRRTILGARRDVRFVPLSTGIPPSLQLPMATFDPRAFVIGAGILVDRTNPKHRTDDTKHSACGGNDGAGRSRPVPGIVSGSSTGCTGSDRCFPIGRSYREILPVA